MSRRAADIARSEPWPMQPASPRSGDRIPRAGGFYEVAWVTFANVNVKILDEHGTEVASRWTLTPEGYAELARVRR